MLRALRNHGRLGRLCAVLTASAGLLTLQTAPALATPDTAEASGVDAQAPARTPLKDLTDNYVGSAVAASALVNENDYRSVLTDEFSSVTAENAMKWSVLEPNRGQYDWSGADAIMDYARQHGKSVRGHTLVWHKQHPGWLNDLSASELRSAVKNHITTVVNRYEGEIRAWDVVNEVFNSDGTRRDSIFQRKLGDGWIADAFRWAHQADPSAKLYINDYNTGWVNDKSNAIYDLVRSLRQQGVPVHGVGFQTHLSIDYSFPGGFQSNLQRFADLGVDVAITEADVRMTLPVTDSKLTTQADYYERLWNACEAVSRCVEFTTWGYTDRHSWVPNTFDGQGAACLFDESLNPKPAYNRINPTA
ncbi:endo-1,4-beta-xylanase [Actinopolyspora lacussalsi subsp. righensis]|uniref:Beta-xylanase n=1 Tax=Actinopolyspora righensis TaxID=995060 RepID=A0A1I6X9G7_9ACTN|nr:endo-1,4-beta-xylanase [Actinopolyspora righensis]SFT34806.1 endo-1,4-beta-xylanase [Actinopolyspora righensis]